MLQDASDVRAAAPVDGASATPFDCPAKCRRRSGVLLAAVAGAILIPAAATSASGAADPLSIAFSSTLPSWPPPPDLDAWSLSSLPVAGGRRALLDRAAPGELVHSSLAPDGERLAVVRGGRVWLVNADGSGERVLFTPDSAAQEAVDLESASLAWAPNGRRIAIGLYSTRYCGPSSTKCAVQYLAIVDLDGRGVGTIGAARNPSWSPEGGLLAVESNDIFGLEPEETTIDIVRPSGETVRTVGRPTPKTRNDYVCLAFPTWSPDARFVTFDESSCNGEAVGGFRVVRAGDGTTVRTGRGWVMDWNPRAGLFAFGDTRRFSVARTRDGAGLYNRRGWFAGWGPEPRSVVYLGRRPQQPLYVAGLGGDSRRLAPSTTGCIRFSPTGSRLYYTGGEMGHPLWSVRTDGHERKRLASRTSGACALPSPDGKLLAFWPTKRRLAVVGASGGPSRGVALFSEGSRKLLLGWADAGRRLLAKSYVTPLAQPALWLTSTDGAAARRVTPAGVGASSPAWSPDGARIAFVRTPGENEQPAGLLSIIGANGRGLRTLVRLRKQQVSSPSWSPGGTMIAYSCRDEHAICAVRSDGSRSRVVVSTVLDPAVGQIYLRSPTWTVDSGWIVYARGEPGRGGSIRAVRPNGTGDRVIVPPNGDGSVFSSVAVSPDGARLAIGGQGCVSPGACGRGIFVADISGEGLRFVTGTADGEGPAWSPDSRTIVFSVVTGVDRRISRLYVVDADGGTPRRITSFDADARDPDWRSSSAMRRALQPSSGS